MQKQVITQVETAVHLQSPRKQIGILGGTFNPVHLGHLIMADQVGTQLGLDQVLLMPDNKPPHVDHKTAIATHHRVAMLERAIADNPLLGLELSEIERGGVSYTYDTIVNLTKQHPENDYYFIIGGDMVAYLPKWHRIDELMKIIQFVGVRRPGYATSSEYPIMWVDAPMMAISSTQIRQKYQQGCSCRYLLPDCVLTYIKQEGLYRNDD